MDKICGIYCIKNLINNKVYIGKSKNLFDRWKKHLYALKSTSHPNYHLQKSYNKHGEDNFTFTILKSFKEIENTLLNELEINFIKEYQSYISLYGYNKTFGGDGGTHTNESKEKISLKLKGRTFTEERKNNIKLANTGKKQSKETIGKRIEKRKIKILQYDLNNNIIKEWDSIREAASKLKISEGQISECINGKAKTCKKFFWKRKYNTINYVQKPKNIYMGKPFQVNQYNLEGILLKTWLSISEASRQTKTSKSAIIKCCKNKQKTSNKFLWKYKL